MKFRFALFTLAAICAPVFAQEPVACDGDGEDDGAIGSNVRRADVL